MRRREFVTFLGGGMAAWSLTVRAQQPEGVRRIGALTAFAETDTEIQAWYATFRKRLDELGWVEGRNMHIDYRWSAGNLELTEVLAKELVRSNPDLLFSITTPATAALQAETHTIPIVFAGVSDPLGSGFVASLKRPGGNITGFINLEASLSSKWLELMHGIAPHVLRVAFMYNPKTAPFSRYYLDTFRSAAPAFPYEPIEAPVQTAAEIEAAITSLAREAGAGLIIMSDTFMFLYRELIISLAARYRLPTIYPYRLFVADGGLLSYGVDNSDLLRRAASYVDRILRGEKPNELPVQLPSKFELAINLKTAKALGLTVPDKLLSTADDVIE
jgi:putative ABC transport system substrate-binding protein